jgi:hypothetical protein
MSSPSDLAAARQETGENWEAALQMIRETIEPLGPSGILRSKEAVGPEPGGAPSGAVVIGFSNKIGDGP